ncbi:hypothetical protein ASE74_16415 [Pedobacter sp. Leaf216]|uniref:hypothetical protein n=1 Tax=Pedobacter sp. Leaf216 TaxID=1735684 RepID=UPI0006FEBC75|nr:hypothetical protein [Pedobacter sp. Leaf216]KQM77973.1 hypothetical protein ASE74_16415 [Pedobacter sp. Leaf216]
MLITSIIVNDSVNFFTKIFYSYDVWKDFVLPITLAGLAAYMVYWGFIKETQRDKKKELEAEEQRQRDKLYYFSNSVKSIHAISRDQNEANSVFAESQAKNPIEVQQITYLSLNELRRMTSDLPLEEFMLAYANYYGSDRKNAVREFNQIIIRIDMLYEAFKNTKLHYEMTQDLEQNAKSKLMQHFGLVHTLVAIISDSFRKSAPPLAYEIDQIARAFQSEQANPSVEFCYHHFFIPFNKFAVKYISTGLPEKALLQELAIQTRDAKAVFEQMIRENRRLSEDFKNKYNSVKPVIEDLEKHAKRLLDDFS